MFVLYERVMSAQLLSNGNLVRLTELKNIYKEPAPLCLNIVHIYFRDILNISYGLS